ncbi:drug/metabolite transporter (DMT)-like permease [Paenibacillus turicensis]|uniref:Drug/metabolite transporter (DMT)-like permease n=1 Tax=Paenibacillus turicensis TaxID=160487 RepID=A0ABS4FNY0_9BACL|nr:DMT family transporter [Paenibacillus turicensis]MBP1904285.1 drug/metabolite transporter (DMT)-like permease [Paenibacillus turicensis]
MTRQNYKSYLAAISYSFIIGFSFLFIKFTLVSAHPLDTLAHRFTVSMAAAVLILLFFKRTRFSVTWKQIMAILPLAILYPLMFFLFQVFGLNFSSTTEAGIFQAMIPIFTMFLAAGFLGERPNLYRKIGIGLSVCGVILIFVLKGVNIGSASMLGGGLILISAFSSAGYNVFARKLVQNYNVFQMTCVMSAIAFIFFNVFAVGRHMVVGDLNLFFQPFLDLKFTLSILYLGILSSLCTSFLSNYALIELEASQMSLFAHLATLITLAAGAFILGEPLSYYHIIGALLIIGGLIFANLQVKNSSTQKS